MNTVVTFVSFDFRSLFATSFVFRLDSESEKLRTSKLLTFHSHTSVSVPFFSTSLGGKIIVVQDSHKHMCITRAVMAMVNRMVCPSVHQVIWCVQGICLQFQSVTNLVSLSLEWPSDMPRTWRSPYIHPDTLKGWTVPNALPGSPPLRSPGAKERAERADRG